MASPNQQGMSDRDARAARRSAQRSAQYVTLFHRPTAALRLAEAPSRRGGEETGARGAAGASGSGTSGASSAISVKRMMEVLDKMPMPEGVVTVRPTVLKSKEGAFPQEVPCQQYTISHNQPSPGADRPALPPRGGEASSSGGGRNFRFASPSPALD